jgi:XTP/dITP diphosphohydrolase
MSPSPSPAPYVLVATDNSDKFAWVRWAFTGSPLEVRPVPAGMYRPVDERGDTCQENALAKARAVQAPVPVIAEDSGLFVDALDGRPGTHTARWFPGDDADRALRILQLLEGTADRTATFLSAVAIRFPDGEETTVVGTAEGVISETAPATVAGYHDVFVSGTGPFPANDAVPPAPHRRAALAHARRILERHPDRM